MINSYSFGSIKIDGKEYTKDVIIYTNQVKSDWWRKEGHSLCPADIKDVIEEKPDVLILGCGESGVLKVPPATIKYIESKGIKVIALPTGDACNKYNELLSENKKVIACLHLTC